MPRAPVTPRSQQTRARLPRIRTAPVRTRGPRQLQPWLNQQQKETQDIPPPEKYLGGRQDGRSLRFLIATGTLPEWYTAWAMISFGLNADEDWFYQAVELGGRSLAGGAVIDFQLPRFRISINVQGLYFHYANTRQEANSRLIRARLAGVNIQLIFVDEDDVLRAPRSTIAAALRGEDQFRMGQGT